MVFCLLSNDIGYGLNAGKGIYVRAEGWGCHKRMAYSSVTLPAGDGTVAAKWLLQDRRVSECSTVELSNVDSEESRKEETTTLK
jgi:hypothetical protein